MTVYNCRCSWTGVTDGSGTPNAFSSGRQRKISFNLARTREWLANAERDGNWQVLAQFGWLSDVVVNWVLLRSRHLLSWICVAASVLSTTDYLAMLNETSHRMSTIRHWAAPRNKSRAANRNRRQYRPEISQKEMFYHPEREREIRAAVIWCNTRSVRASRDPGRTQRADQSRRSRREGERGR